MTHKFHEIFRVFFFFFFFHKNDNVTRGNCPWNMPPFISPLDVLQCGPTLRAACGNYELYPCKIEKFDFLKLCHNKGLCYLVTNIELWNCLDFYFLGETRFSNFLSQRPKSVLKLHFYRNLAKQNRNRTSKNWRLSLKYHPSKAI